MHCHISPINQFPEVANSILASFKKNQTHKQQLISMITVCGWVVAPLKKTTSTSSRLQQVNRMSYLWSCISQVLAIRTSGIWVRRGGIFNLGFLNTIFRRVITINNLQFH